MRARELVMEELNFELSHAIKSSRESYSTIIDL